MPLRNYNNSALLPSSLLLLAILTFAGCGGKPWTTSIEGERFAATKELVDSLVQEQQGCGKSFEGDLALFYSDPLEKKALSGYLRFSMPGSYKFVVANPLGQTLLAIAGNQKSYQAVNVPERLFMSGSLRSFGIRHHLPTEILNGQWGEWITARNLRSSDTMSAIRADKKDRGLWISFRNGTAEPAGMSHLLLEPVSRLPLIRILENGAGTTFAEVTYGNWTSEGSCRQPQEININRP